MRFGIPNILALISVIAVFIAACKYGVEGPILVLVTFGPLVLATPSMMFQKIDPSLRRLIVYGMLGVLVVVVSIFLNPMFGIIIGLWWMPQLFVVEALHQANYRDFSAINSRRIRQENTGEVASSRMGAPNDPGSADFPREAKS